MANKNDLTTLAGLTKAFGSISSRGQKLRDEIQTVVIATMIFMDKHGNYKDSAVKLFEAMDGMGKNNRRAVEEYFLAYTWLAYDAKHKDKNGKSEPWFKDSSKKMDLKGAEAPLLDKDGQPILRKGKPVLQTWYSMERDVKETPFDAQKAVNALWIRVLSQGQTTEAIAAMEKLIADHKTNEAKLDAESLKAEVTKKVKKGETLPTA